MKKISDETKALLFIYYDEIKNSYDAYKENINNLTEITFDNFITISEDIDNMNYNSWCYLQTYSKNKDLAWSDKEYKLGFLFNKTYYRKVFDSKRKLPRIDDLMKKVLNRIIDIQKTIIT